MIKDHDITKAKYNDKRNVVSNIASNNSLEMHLIHVKQQRPVEHPERFRDYSGQFQEEKLNQLKLWTTAQNVYNNSIFTLDHQVTPHL